MIALWVEIFSYDSRQRRETPLIYEV